MYNKDSQILILDLCDWLFDGLFFIGYRQMNHYSFVLLKLKMCYTMLRFLFMSFKQDF